MARMYPQQPSPDTESRAELKLFSALERQLPNDYTVFHSVAWQLRDKYSGVRDGETDFLVVHPDFGMLIVEVKGGRIRYDGQQDQWYSTNNAIKDPFKQGRNNKYSLLAKLQETSFWRDRWITIGYSVAFPDVSVKSDLRLDAPRELILDEADMYNVATWVQEAIGYLRAKRPNDQSPDEMGVSELVRTFSPSWELRHLLSVDFEREGETIARLTTEQFTMLDFLSRHRRAAISGCAGSGKTTLAYEKARRLAEQGFKVLLTCFNKSLAVELNHIEDKPANLVVGNFHRLGDKLVQQAGMPTGPYNSQYFDQILPERLVEAVDMLGSQFDAIVIDEGQDVEDNWWVALQCLLHDPDQGIFYIFFDDNQNIYRAAKKVPLDLAPYPLTKNCRNTRLIHKQVTRFYRSDVTPVAIGPQGHPVERLTYQDVNELKRHLRKTLHHLINEEGISAWDIVVLTPKNRQHSQLWQLGPLGNFTLIDTQTYTDSEIYCTTVHNFKGLESPVVILAEIDNDQIWNLETILYVGCSRARNHLVLLTAADLSDKIKTKLAE